MLGTVMPNKTIALIVSVLVLIVVISGCNPTPPAEPKQTRDILVVYIGDGTGNEPGAIKIAEIRVDAGKINLTTDYPDTEELKHAIAEIEARPGLVLTFENMEEGGKLVMYAVNVTPQDRNYIYALKETLLMDYGIRSAIGKEPV
jgi:hypothetical protein